MKYISVCSGIEAASVAWQPLGWEAVAFSEIEAFPNAVLAYRFPDVPNLGDISKVDWRPYHGTVDLVVGGTPCQSFSVAGKREGLDGASGLVREYFRLLDEVRPRWFVWENVPGSLSSGNPKGSDFEFILQQWSHIGYHVSWRVLDAQYFGVAQRRRRVFAVGSLGDWRDSVKVLFEPESMSGHPAPCRKAREENPRGSATGAGKTSGFRMTAFGEYADDDTGSALKARDYKDATDLAMFHQASVRRLTPTECERLQGFPDGWTDIEFRGKPAPDGARYKALGNSMAVPCMAWIGKRIQMAEDGEL